MIKDFPERNLGFLIEKHKSRFLCGKKTIGAVTRDPNRRPDTRLGFWGGGRTAVGFLPRTALLPGGGPDVSFT